MLKVEIEMTQGFDDRGVLITHVSKNFDEYRKYPFYGITGDIKIPIARFKVKIPFKKRFFESKYNFIERIKNTLYKHLEIYNEHRNPHHNMESR
jgi:hypothetical protein